MAKYLTITNSDTDKTGIRKKTISSKINLGPVTLTIITIVLVCLLSLFYLSQIFTSSTKGYEMSDLEKRASGLREENRKLEIKAAELKSYKLLEEEAKKLNMVSPEKIIYISRYGGTVVVGR